MYRRRRGGKLQKRKRKVSCIATDEDGNKSGAQFVGGIAGQAVSCMVIGCTNSGGSPACNLSAALWAKTRMAVLIAFRRITPPPRSKTA